MLRCTLSVAAALLTPLVASSGQVPERTLLAESRFDRTVGALARTDLLVPTRDGYLFIAQSAERQLQVMDKAGASVATVKRNLPRGRTIVDSGPPDLMTLGRWGDGMWSFDEATLRLSLLTSSGQLLRTVRLPNPIALRETAYGLASVEAIYPDSSILFSAERWTVFDNNMVRDGHVLMRVGLDGTIRHRFLLLPPGTERLSIFRAGETQDTAAHNPAWGVSSDGERIVHATANTEGRDRGQITVTMLSAKSDTLYRTRIPFDPQAGWPLVGRALVGVDGTVWLRLRTARDGRPWLVLDRTGTPVARVTVPDSIRVASIDEGIWGVETTAGRGTVVRYRVVDR